MGLRVAPECRSLHLHLWGPPLLLLHHVESRAAHLIPASPLSNGVLWPHGGPTGCLTLSTDPFVIDATTWMRVQSWFIRYQSFFTFWSGLIEEAIQSLISNMIMHQDFRKIVLESKLKIVLFFAKLMLNHCSGQMPDAPKKHLAAQTILLVVASLPTRTPD